MAGPPKKGMYPMNSQHGIKQREIHVNKAYYGAASAYSAFSSNDLLKWHFKLGHPSLSVLKKVLQLCNVHVKNDDHFVCEACQLGKSKHLPFSNSTSHAIHPFDLVHSDLWGPTPIQSTGGCRYYINFIDDFSRFTWIYPLKQKSDAVIAFKHFQHFVKTQFNTMIKEFQCDNGAKYNAIATFATNEGTIIRFTCRYTS